MRLLVTSSPEYREHRSQRIPGICPRSQVGVEHGVLSLDMRAFPGDPRAVFLKCYHIWSEITNDFNIE